LVVYRRFEGAPTRSDARRQARQWKLEGFDFDADQFVRRHRQAALTFSLDGQIRIDSTSAVAPYVREGDWARAARFVAQRLINQGLDLHAHARLLYEPDSRELNRHVVPRNLLGAMWIQIAAMAEGTRAYTRCKQCRRWFVLSQEIRRADRAYCSDRCRHKAIETADGVPES
jgi:hypothetical protein